jgi:mannose/cellobiose epimerase-like protein (N-acyl-D-glucosamine 2-epimerase family)
LHRHRQHPGWPYIDTKFNPNTGRDLPEASYDIVFAWFLGRGTESLIEHDRWLDQIEGLGEPERQEIRSYLRTVSHRMAADLNNILDRNRGRCPFRVNRDLQAINEHGLPVAMEPDCCGAGDIFAAKALISVGTPSNIDRGAAMLQRIAELVRHERFEVQQFAEQPSEIGQRSKMLLLGGLACACRRSRALRKTLLPIAAEMLTNVLDRHYDPASMLFSEYIRRDTLEPTGYLDSGHATELVGFALQATELMREDSTGGTSPYDALVARAHHELPRLLVIAGQRGFNPSHPGLYRAVDTRTGEPINSDMPWWNLPETMRAAVRAYEVCGEPPLRQQCLDLLVRCHNAYFGRYLNRDNWLFPYQTISGETGQVVDKVPAVPEGDPLYHANLSLMDMLDVLHRLRG